VWLASLAAVDELHIPGSCLSAFYYSVSGSVSSVIMRANLNMAFCSGMLLFLYYNSYRNLIEAANTKQHKVLTSNSLKMAERLPKHVEDL
jgi:hypothetical protein